MHMKNIFKSALVLVATVSVVACNVENIGTTYDPAEHGSAVSFVQTVVNNTTLPASTTSYNVVIGRSNASVAETVNLTSTLPDGMCPSSVSFAAGESSANIVLDLSTLNVGTTCKGFIAIDGQADFSRDAINVTLAKAYEWTSLGTGEFLENFWEGFVADVEIIKAEGFDIYRVLNPYAEASEGTGNGPAYIQFEIVDKAKGIVHFDTFTTNFDYDGGGNFVKGYRPSEASASYAAYDDYSLIDSNYYVALVPYWYVDGVGGWGVKYGYTIGIALPGAPKSIVDWFDENGLL